MRKYRIDIAPVGFNLRSDVRREDWRPVGINWPACGTVTVAEARRFLAALNKAVEKAAKLNR
jgi:hypothetical protein